MSRKPPQNRKARTLRRWMTEPEDVLWQALRGRRTGGLKFRRKSPVGPYVVDFLCPSARLVVEVTGRGQHRKILEDRDAALQALGYAVLRVGRPAVEHDPAAILRQIERTATARS